MVLSHVYVQCMHRRNGGVHTCVNGGMPSRTCSDHRPVGFLSDSFSIPWGNRETKKPKLRGEEKRRNMGSGCR